MKSERLKSMVICALFAAVICVIAPHSIPIGPIPVTLGVMAVAFTAAVLGAKKGVAATALYILIGAAGMPVFSSYGAGIGKITNITGGYITGYLPLALAIGLAADIKTENRLIRAAVTIVSSAAGLVVFYAFAMLHYMLVTKSSLQVSFMATVAPFALIDAVKIAAANILGKTVQRIVTKAGLMKKR